MNREIKTKMKKIKSVKLKNDFRTAHTFIPKGTELTTTNDGYYFIGNKSLYYSIQQIENCTTDLFEIEYFPERKSITVKIEYESEYNLHTDYIKSAIGYYNINFNFNVTKVTEVKND